MNKLTFSVDKVKLLEQINNSQFTRARVWAFASGENAHGKPVLESALHSAESSIYEKPLVWKYNMLTNDAGTHEAGEIPCGFVPRTGANITYERADDGRLFFVCDVLIWNLYCGKIIEVFERTDNKKSVSVEIVLIETTEADNVESISEFQYLAITVLGEKFSPAIPGANAKLVYSTDKSEVEEILQQAFSDINLEEKEGDEVTFNKIEFAQKLNLTANEMYESLRGAINAVKYQADGSECSYLRYWMRDWDAEYAYAFDEKEGKLCSIPYAMEGIKVTLDFENVKSARLTYIVGEDETTTTVKDFAKEVMNKEFGEIEVEITTLREKFSATETQNSEFATKFSTQETELNTLKSENATLLEFKANVEKEAKTAKMEFAINAVAEDLTKEQTEEWRIKFDEFGSADEFSNAIKAFAYECSRGKSKGKKPEIVRMSLPDNIQDVVNKPKSIWEKA